jgi:hypothetical protein
MKNLILLAGLGAFTTLAYGQGTIYATPHDSYSSSIGVLGCKVNTDRIAYWPMAPDCSNICVKVSYAGRSVNLLRIDQSGGAHDMSYDAWNYLYTGFSATERPTAGGGINMQWEPVDASQCAKLIYSGGKLAFSAANSMNFISSCLSQSNSWVARNHVLYNIADPLCSWGIDETCSLDLAQSNQPQCSHQLGLPTPLNGQPVWNIRYPSGQKVSANGNDLKSRSVKLLNAKTCFRLLASSFLVYFLVLSYL